MNTISKSGSRAQCPRHVRTSSQDELITENLSLVRSIAGSVLKSIPVHVDRDDLIQAGMKGLIEAASKYTPGRDTTFPTYASHRIRGAILDSLRQLDPASRYLRNVYRKAQVTREQIRVKLEREPSDEEMAAAMNLDNHRWRSLMVSFRYLTAVPAPARNDHEEQSAPEIPCTSGYMPDRSYAFAEMRHRLEGVIRTLPKQHQQVVTLYYDRALTMKEVGAALGIKESRASQIHKCALNRMRNVFENVGILSARALAA